MRAAVMGILVLSVAAWGQSPAPLVGSWYLTNTEWANPDTLEPPRSLRLVLSADGGASLDSAIVSRSFRTTVDGCKVNETRRDQHTLRGTYQATADSIVFHWREPAGSEQFLSDYFRPLGAGSYRWPRPVGREITVPLTDKVLTVERIDSQEPGN